MTQEKPPLILCIRCDRPGKAEELIPLSMIDSKSLCSSKPAFWIHPDCAKAFIAEYMAATSVLIASAVSTTTTGVADINKVRALKSLADSVQEAEKALRETITCNPKSD